MILIKCGGTRVLAEAVLRECGECPIKDIAVCARSTGDELAYLNKIKSYQTYRPGETIVWRGDQLNFLGSLVTGSATISQTLEDGRRQIVGLLLPGDFVGRPMRKTAPFDVTANAELVMCKFEIRKFEALMATSTTIPQRLLSMTLDELDVAREWMIILGRKTARERIASLLVSIARREAARQGADLRTGIGFEIPLTREMMADYLGLTIETASRQMTNLRKDGVIGLEGNRTVTVPDFSALLEASGEDDDGGVVA